LNDLKIDKKKILDIEVPYYHSGNNESAAIFFIHGNRGSGLTFQSVLASRLSHKYKLIALDLPGFGDNKVQEDLHEQITWNFLKRLIIDFTNSFSYSNTILCGHSMGGHLAIECIHQIKDRKGLVFFGAPPVSGIQDMPNAFLPNPKMEFLLKADLSESEIELLIADSSKNKKTQDFLNTIARKADPRVLDKVYESITYQVEDEVKLLSPIQSFPICCIHVENDPLVNYQYIVDLKLPNLFRGEVITIKGDGHIPQIDYLNDFLKILESYVEEVISL